MTEPLIAIGRRLARFPAFTTLGVRPNLLDYPPESLALIRRAKRIFYPTQAFFAQFVAMGKGIYPSLQSHLLEGDKIKQTAMFNLLGVPHPRTRVFHGRQRLFITDYFSFPFVAKKPRASAQGRGVFLLKGPEDLDEYLSRHDPAYVQEYLPIERDVRVVVVGYEPVCAYWRHSPKGEFRSNLAQGGQVDFSDVPPEAVDLAVKVARKCGLDEVGVDVAVVGDEVMVLEFNVKFGHRGPALAGIDIPAFVASRILAGKL